jgi:hypothetical protein
LIAATKNAEGLFRGAKRNVSRQSRKSLESL